MTASLRATTDDNTQPDPTLIALAGLLQALSLVCQTARRDEGDDNAFACCIDSVFRIDAQSAQAVYGELSALEPGLRVLVAHLGGTARDPELSRHLVAVLRLERQLSKSPALLNRIREEIEAASLLAETSGGTDPTVVARLAEAYLATASTVSPRIIVKGDPERLQRAEIAQRIRALLLAAIRAAVLWRQMGGSRWRLFIGRARLVAQAQGLLETLT